MELEAYLGEDDLASHARFGRTARNAVMYGPPGRAYVYLVYGMHDCLNLVCEPEGRAAALLVRAVEPLEGAATMAAARLARSAARRKAPRNSGAATDLVAERDRLARSARLASGPGLVAAGFDLTRAHTGLDLFDPTGAIRIEPRPADEPAQAVVTGPRVGIAYAGEPWAGAPWRFGIAGHPALSRPAFPG